MKNFCYKNILITFANLQHNLCSPLFCSPFHCMDRPREVLVKLKGVVFSWFGGVYLLIS